MAAGEIDWDNVPDDELEESWLERIEGLREMFPPSMRRTLGATYSWGWAMAGKTFSFTRNALWIVSTSAAIMIMPFLIEKELSDLEKSQVKQQQQILLGPMAAATADAKKGGGQALPR